MNNEIYLIWRTSYGEPTRTRLYVQFFTADADYLLSYNPTEAKIYTKKSDAEQEIKDFKLEGADVEIVIINPNYLRRLNRLFAQRSIITYKKFCEYIKQQADDSK